MTYLSPKPNHGYEAPTAANLESMRGQFAGERGVIALDLDGTLTDQTTGTITDDAINDALREAQAAGFTICINSDRPAAYIEDMQSRLRLNTPYVAESGGVVGFPALDIRVLLDPVARASVDKVYPKIRDSLSERFVSEDVTYLAFDDEDPVGSIARWKDFRNAAGIDTDSAVVLVRPKETSFGCWVVDSIDGCPQPNEANTDVVQGAASKLLEGLRPANMISNRSRTFFEVRAGLLTKTLVWRALLELIDDDSKHFFHLGDGAPDIIGDPRVKSLVVANARSGVKRVASRVSEHKSTSGTVDNLRWIMARTSGLQSR